MAAEEQNNNPVRLLHGNNYYYIHITVFWVEKRIAWEVHSKNYLNLYMYIFLSMKFI